MADTKPGQVDPRFLEFQKNLRRTAFGIKFARALFTGGNKSLSQKFIREGFKQLGLEIPKEVEITLDAAQAITAGVAMVDAIEAYQTFDDAKNVVQLGTDSLASTVRVAQALGWVDSNSQEVQMIRTATNVAMIIGSGGTDVKSWISLALDFYSWEAQAGMRAQQLANGWLADNLRARINPQAKAAAQVLKEFQEGKISSFAFVGKMAEASPDLWPQFFPQFGKWAPVYTTEMQVSAQVRTWYGATQGASARHVWQTIAGYTPTMIRDFVFFYLAEPTLYPFYVANDAYRGQNKASLVQMAVLSVLTGFDFIAPHEDYTKLLIANELTLSDFENPRILQYLEDLQDPLKKYRLAAVTIDGKPQYSKAVMEKYGPEISLYQNRDILESLERAGRIDVISKVPQLRKVLKDTMTFPAIDVNQAYGAWNETGLVNYGRGGETDREQSSLRVAGAGLAWRKVRNYFAALGMIEELRKDEYFNTAEYKDTTANAYIVGDIVFGARTIQTYDFLGTVDAFESLHREISFKSTIRKINTLALGNVAYFLGTTPDKLVRVNRGETTESAVYDKRG